MLLLNAMVMGQGRANYPFMDEIRAYRHQDSLSVPPANGMLFIGSSSIRKWTDLPAHFPGKPVIMRGVGGSTLAQWAQYYMPLLVYPYHPAKIFIYVGENDINDGVGAQAVYHNFLKLLGMIKRKLPNAQVYFLSVKQSPSRAAHYNEVTLCDELIAAYIKNRANIYYIDVNTPLLTRGAKPDSALFQKDMLHLNSDGYQRWEKVISNYLN